MEKRLIDCETAKEELVEKAETLEAKLKDCLENVDSKVKDMFKEFLTPNQIDMILKRRSRGRWNQEEISKAFTLRYLSKRAYVYLKEVCKYPLPGLSTLQRWASKFTIRNGFFEDVFNIMGSYGAAKDLFQKVCVVSYDEVKVTSVYEYDVKEQEIVGPHTYMQVIMARGLFDNWKQVLYAYFDTKMTEELLKEAITKLHKAGYIVVACVSDCGGGNQGLKTTLGVVEGHPYILHPITGEKIYFFADAPHLLKLIRNWFLDTGFELEDGSIVNQKPIKALIDNSNKSEISSCHKLSNSHISCERAERQNVRLAAELLSHTTATALKTYLPGDNPDLAKKTGDVIETISEWWDVMNSYSPSASVPTKKPFGIHFEQQKAALEKMLHLMSTMRCAGKPSMQIFQKHFINQICLYEDMKRKYKAKYILTHRLNQDCLEKFFSQIRTRGGLHDHPSPLQSLYRVRMVILGKNPGVVQLNTNFCAERTEEEYVVASSLRGADIIDVDAMMAAEQEPEVANYDVVVIDCSQFASPKLSQASSTTNSSAVGTQICERDGLEYLAGYLAKKHRTEFPYLGQPTSKNVNHSSYDISKPSWVRSLSFEGLIQPSPKWLNEIYKMETYFQKYHKSTFKVRSRIVEETTHYLAKKLKDEIHPKLLEYFSKQRILLRVNYLNSKRAKKARPESAVRRKRKDEKEGETAEQRKARKKMRRIIQ